MVKKKKDKVEKHEDDYFHIRKKNMIWFLIPIWPLWIAVAATFWILCVLLDAVVKIGLGLIYGFFAIDSDEEHAFLYIPNPSVVLDKLDIFKWLK